MCGINGIVRTDPAALPVDVAEAMRTREHMLSRGPDGAGIWSDSAGDVVLAHRRLSIIDLSDAGLQPMVSADGRYWIVFNGEIYNYRELRASLVKDYPFRSQSDTEVILALVARLGEQALSRLRGMFALAIWDTRERRLLLARDPNGIKPLYYCLDRGQLRFASTVKSLLAGGGVADQLDPAGLCGFLLWGSVPEPLTLYRSVRALPAGHVLTVDGSNGTRGPEPVPVSGSVGSGDLVESIEESIAAHLVSDAPVAVFLSAGLDSSMVAAAAGRRLSAPPLLITLRFREFEGTEDDEGPIAADVARAVGAPHVERWVSRDEFQASWDDVLSAMDQPSIDGLNTYWVCKSAREAGVKVALSGLGGDELLGGYPSFRDVPLWNRRVRRVRSVPGASALWPALARRFGSRTPKLQGMLRYGTSLEGAYFLRRGLFLPEELPALVGSEVARAGLEAYDPLRDRRRILATEPHSDSWEAVQALETALYLRNQLLRDADWASMAHSVELRVPFVDAQLQRAATDSRNRLSREIGKRGIAARVGPELPHALFERRKTGFRTPAAEWLHDSDLRLSRGSRLMAARALKAFGLEPVTVPA